LIQVTEVIVGHDEKCRNARGAGAVCPHSSHSSIKKY
jgi:hypothetical protein